MSKAALKIGDIEVIEVGEGELERLKELVKAGRYNLACDAFVVPRRAIEEAALSWNLFYHLHLATHVSEHDYMVALDTERLAQLGIDVFEELAKEELDKPLEPNHLPPLIESGAVTLDEITIRLQQMLATINQMSEGEFVDPPTVGGLMLNRPQPELIQPAIPEEVQRVLERIADAIPPTTLAMAEECGTPDSWEVDHKVTLGEVKVVRAYLNEIKASD